MTERQELSRLIREAQLEEMQEALLTAAQPSIRLTAEAAPDDSIPPGASKLGGSPDLSAASTWPTMSEGSLSFVGQINLQEVQPYDPDGLLPSSGLLSFFYRDRLDLRESTRWWNAWDWHVAYIEQDPATLQRRTSPADFAPMNMVYKPCRLSFQQAITLPDFFSIPAREKLGFDVDMLKDISRRPIADRYFNLLLSLLGSKSSRVIHRMLGYPDLIQFYIVNEVEHFARNRVELLEHYAPQLSTGPDWILLLQIDSEPEAGMMWGDVGRLYFFITAEDLASRNFEYAICIMQCT